MGSLHWLAIILVVSLASTSQAIPIKSSAGLGLGGNGTLLFSDASLGAFGVGAGYQGSTFWNLWDDHPIALKIRIERLSLTEEATQKSPTDFLAPGTLLKSMTQTWTAFSAGAEGKFEKHGQIFYWEALLGYAVGSGSTVSVTTGQLGSTVNDSPQTTSSGFTISGGAGIKRIFSPLITGIMDVRTFYLIGAPYSSGAMAGKAYIPFPVMLTFGASYAFDFLK